MLTYHYSNMRQGANTSETTLTPANVNPNHFGLLHILPMYGRVDAGPLVVTNITINGVVHSSVVYAADEHDVVGAFDANSGTPLLIQSMVPANESNSDNVGCGDDTPELGISGTPVIDLNAGPNGTIFVVAATKDANGIYHQRLHALDLTTLLDRMPATEIQATAPTGVAFGASQVKMRGAMTLTNGQIITIWGSHCDDLPYNGWIIAFNESDLAQSAAVTDTPSGSMGGIWSASGLGADANGYLFGMAGNGTFDTTFDGNGFPSLGDFGNTAFRLSLGGGAFTMLDFFADMGVVAEAANDQDLGSGSPLLLPDMVDASGTTRQLMVATGKVGILRLLDRNNMGRFSPTTDNAWQELQTTGNYLQGGVYTSMAYFNGTLYVGGYQSPVEAWPFTNAMLGSAPSSVSAHSFGYPGTSPSISANGTSNAIVWVVESNMVAPQVLYAYDARNLATKLYDSTLAANGRDNMGFGNKFQSPVVANGKVLVGLVGNQSSGGSIPGGVAVYGLLP